MDIKVVPYSYHFQGKDNKLFAITVNTSSVSLEEDSFTEKEAHALAISFLEDTVLDKCWQSEIVAKLVEAGVISHEMILEYVAESEIG